MISWNVKEKHMAEAESFAAVCGQYGNNIYVNG